MANLILEIGRQLARAMTVTVLLPGCGTVALFLYAWWARRRALGY